jgi:hypothetical protein
VRSGGRSYRQRVARGRGSAQRVGWLVVSLVWLVTAAQVWLVRWAPETLRHRLGLGPFLLGVLVLMAIVIAARRLPGPGPGRFRTRLGRAAGDQLSNCTMVVAVGGPCDGLLLPRSQGSGQDLQAQIWLTSDRQRYCYKRGPTRPDATGGPGVVEYRYQPLRAV